MEQSDQIDNIFSKGCLVQLEVHKWGGVKKIDKAIAHAALGSEWTRANKDLVDPGSLKPVAKKANEARTYLNSLALPFPIKGLVFVPKDLIANIDSRLTALKYDYMDQVDQFVTDFAMLREVASDYLGEYFNELDYPIDIGKKFDMTWRFVIMDTPQNAGLLSPELYEKEKAKFLSTMDEARAMGIDALRSEFGELVTRMIDRLKPTADGKQKIFRNSLVGNFTDFFETFKSRNVFDDAALSEVIDQAQTVLTGVDVNNLRTDDALKDTLKTEMSKVNDALKDAVKNKPARKISM